MDKKYWENYYKSHPLAEHPSLFAKYVLAHHLVEGETLIELGCGNGRDAVFFARHKIDVLAVDQCEGELAALAQKNDLSNLKFKCADFTSLGDIGSFDYIYSRFTLHVISEEQEDRVIKWAHDHLNKGGKFFIEARGHKNELHKLGEKVPNEDHAYIYDNHYRRFIPIDALQEKLEKNGFKIIQSEEKTGFAPFGDTDYHFIRKVAVKR